MCNQSSYILQAYNLSPRDKAIADVATATASAFRQIAGDTPNKLLIIKTSRCDIIKEVITYPAVVAHIYTSVLFIYTTHTHTHTHTHIYIYIYIYIYITYFEHMAIIGYHHKNGEN